jgi:hypothetical protein
MGTIHYALNENIKQLVCLGKTLPLRDDDSPNGLNLSDAVLHEYDGLLDEAQVAHWKSVIMFLRTFGATKVVNDSSTDLYDEYPEYLIVHSVYSPDTDVGLTVKAKYERYFK